MVRPAKAQQRHCLLVVVGVTLSLPLLPLARHLEELEPPSYYERCVEIGPPGVEELSNFILEWNIVPEPQNRLQLALHGRGHRGYVGLGFNTPKGMQLVGGHPNDDTSCIRAMFDNSTSYAYDDEGNLYDFDVEVPGMSIVQDEWWIHITMERNLSVGVDTHVADIFSSPFEMTFVWAHRWSAILDGTCQDFSMVDTITERAHFVLDLKDTGGLYTNPVKQKVFAPGEARCNHLNPSLISSDTGALHGAEGLLAGEMHQSNRIAFLIVGGSLGLKSGKEEPDYDMVSGFVKGGEGGNGQCQSSTTVFYAQWDGFTDPIGGISYYVVNLVSERTGEKPIEDKDVGLVTYAELPVTLTPNDTVVFTVTAYNHAGRSTSVSTGRIRVLNNAKPLWAKLYTGKVKWVNVEWWTSATEFHGSWSDFEWEDRSGTDPGTAPKPYSYAIGEVGKNETALLDWTDTTDDSFAVTGLTLVNAGQYYYTVSTVNCAGVKTKIASKPVTVDLDPPVAGVVYDGNATSPGDTEFIYPSSPVYAQWEGFSDAVSGLDHYEWAIGIQKATTSTEVLSWTSVGLATQADTALPTGGSSLGNLLSIPGVAGGTTLYVHVKAFDKAGWFSTASSNGTTLLVNP